MIPKFNDYDKTRGLSDSQQLPRGGYVCKIIGAKVQDSGFGQTIKIAYDIAEGDHTGFYQQKFDSNTNEDKKWPAVFLLNIPSDDGSDQDNWTKRKFRTFTDALEDSNTGYHFDWDESKFKGKLIGFVMNYREWTAPDGRTVLSPNPARALSADKIRSGDFKIPDDKLLSNKQVQAASPDDFVNVPEGTEEEVPF